MPKKRRQQVVVQRQMTRGQLSHHQRDLRQQRMLYYGMGGVAALVLLILGYVGVNEWVIKPAQANAALQTVVATVNNTDISRAEYNKVRSFSLFNQINTYVYYQNLGINTGQDLTTQITQLQAQLGTVGTDPVDQSTLESIADGVLMDQKAGDVGVKITDADVQAEAVKNFEPQPTPIPGPTDTVTPTPATIPPTATSTPPTPVPTLTPTATHTRTPGPSPTQTTTPTVTNTPLPVPGAQLTATVQYQQFITSIKKGPTPSAGDPFCGYGCPGLTEQEYLQWIVRPQLLQTKITDALKASAPTTQEEVHAAHILFGINSTAYPQYTHTDTESLQLAQTTLARLKAGEDFSKLAAELSDDTSNKDSGGDLGWFAPTEKGGSMVQAFSDAAFKLTTPGQLSDPVKTEFGYHIIKLIERGQQPMDATALQNAQSQAFTNWLNDQRAKNKYLILGVQPTPIPPTTVALPTEPPLPAVTNPPITGTVTLPTATTAPLTGTLVLPTTTTAAATSPITTTGTITK